MRLLFDEQLSEALCLLLRLSILRGAPPKVVWLRLGNSTTKDVARLLREHVADLQAFAEQAEATFLELG